MKVKKSLNFILLVAFLPFHGICEEIRVVSLAPVATEIIYALGAQSSLIGVTDICNLEDGRKVSRLGAYSAVSPEAVYNLSPTLVLVTEGAENQANMLVALGLNIVEIKTSSLSLVKKSILEVSKKMSLQAKGEEILKEGERSLAQLAKLGIKTKLKEKNVLLLFGDEGSHFGAFSFYGIGAATFYNDLIEVVGLKNAIKQKGYNILSLEGLCSLKPDCIVLASDGGEKEKVGAIKNCHKKVKIMKFPKSPFLYPGIKYPEIAESIATCIGS